MSTSMGARTFPLRTSIESPKTPPDSTRSAPGILLDPPNRKLVVQGEFRRVDVGLHDNACLVDKPIDLKVQEHLMAVR